MCDGGMIRAVGIRSLPSNHKVSGSIPGSAEILNICVVFFSAEIDSVFHRYEIGTKICIRFCWELICDGLVSSPGGFEDFHSLNVHRICSMSHSVCKDLAYNVCDTMR